MLSVYVHIPIVLVRCQSTAHAFQSMRAYVLHLAQLMLFRVCAHVLQLKPEMSAARTQENRDFSSYRPTPTSRDLAPVLQSHDSHFEGLDRNQPSFPDLGRTVAAMELDRTDCKPSRIIAPKSEENA